MFAEWLDEQMDVMGWTNAYLAERVGVTTGAVWSWRHAEYLPVLKHLPLIAEAFGVSEFEIYCRVRGIQYDEMQDGVLMRRLGIQPDDSEYLIDLTRALLASVRDWAKDQGRQQRAEPPFLVHVWTKGQAMPDDPECDDDDEASGSRGRRGSGGPPHRASG